MDYGQIKALGKLFAPLPTEVVYMGCVWCIGYYALLEHLDNRQKGLSIAKLAHLSNTNWETANGHVREHLAKAGWVSIMEPTAAGGRAVVKVAHNPSKGRDLYAVRTLPLAEVAKTKPSSTRKPKTSPITEKNLSDNREVGLRYQGASSPITESFEREPSVCDLYSPATVEADVAARNGGKGESSEEGDAA